MCDVDESVYYIITSRDNIYIYTSLLAESKHIVICDMKHDRIII